MPPPRKRLGKSQPQCARVSAPRLHQAHATKALQSIMMISDRLLGIRGQMQNLQSGLGIAALIAVAWAISENRRAVSPKRVGIGLIISLVLAALFLKVPPITAAIGSANHVIDAIAEAS